MTKFLLLISLFQPRTGFLEAGDSLAYDAYCKLQAGDELPYVAHCMNEEAVAELTASTEVQSKLCEERIANRLAIVGIINQKENDKCQLELELEKKKTVQLLEIKDQKIQELQSDDKLAEFLTWGGFVGGFVLGGVATYYVGKAFD